MTNASRTTVLYGRRHGAGLWFAIAVLGAAFGAAMVAGGAWAGWVLVIIFAPSAILLGAALRPAANALQLDPNGYTISTLRSGTTVPWTDVERIGVHEGLREPLVAIRLTAAAAAQDPESAAIAADLGGYHRTLPMTYGVPADELAALMDGYRAGWT